MSEYIRYPLVKQNMEIHLNFRTKLSKHLTLFYGLRVLEDCVELNNQFLGGIWYIIHTLYI